MTAGMIATETNNEKKNDAPAGVAHGLGSMKLKAAGLSFLLGDAGLFAYGIATKNKKFGAAALFGWTEGLIGARYGNPKVEKQLE